MGIKQKKMTTHYKMRYLNSVNQINKWITIRKPNNGQE